MPSPVETALGFLPVNSSIQKFIAFLDRFGDGSSLAPLHAPINTAGARIDPATDESVQAISAKLPVSLGQKGGAASLPVVLSSDGPFSTYATQIGSQADAAATTDAGTFSLFALFKRSLGYLGQIAGTVSSGALLTAIKSNAPRVTATGSLAAANATLSLAVDGMSTISMQISGTWAGAIALYGSMDGGATYPYLIGLKPVGSGGGPTVSSFTANGGWDRSAAAYTHIQAQMPTFTSGSATVLLSAFNGVKFARVEAPASDPLPVNLCVGSPLESSTVPTALTGLNLLSTQAASSRIGFWFCQNQSGNEITVALDDGAGNNLSVFLLNPTAAGQQGGSMGSADTGPHVGRIRVYGAAGSTHALRAQ